MPLLKTKINQQCLLISFAIRLHNIHKFLTQNFQNSIEVQELFITKFWNNFSVIISKWIMKILRQLCLLKKIS